MKLAHLHCHSTYSLLDGQSKIPNLVKRVKSLGMNSIAVTDHGNMHGFVELMKECKSQHIKPIAGIEAYVAPFSLFDHTKGGANGKEHSFHLTLLAQNGTGVRNLFQLTSKAFLEGYYYKPRIDKEILELHSEGVICLSGCVSSEFSDMVLAGDIDGAKRYCEWAVKVFGKNYFIEIQDNGVDIQHDHLGPAVDIANQMGIPLVGTSDAHYLTQGDSVPHDVLLCINTGRTIDDPNRMRFDTDQFHVRSPEEMYAAMPDHHEAVARSQDIADSVEENYGSLDFGKRCYPSFETPGTTPEAKLRELCLEGVKVRYPDAGPEIYERLDHELGIINQMGFASYFLIVWDVVRYCRENEIPCGARGSACGAIVSYLLYISHICPLEHTLLFERFLDPSRAEAPDIDIDICQHNRGRVIEYVREKYGEDRVAQIVAFGTLGARAAIRDVAKAIGYQNADVISKMIGDEVKITIQGAIDKEQSLRDLINQDSEAKRLIELAQGIEGTARNCSTHAAGVVITPVPLIELVPLMKVKSASKDRDTISTQWSMGDVEKAGLLKMDFLGLRNLTVLSKAVDLVRERHDPNFDVYKLPLDDPEAFALLQRGETKGIFQLESQGIRELLVKMKPDQFGDITAVAALYRPGPLEGGMVNSYVERKHGRETWEDTHPIMSEILASTYNIMIYQEQIMLILHRLGGIPLAKAYATIKAISKKKTEDIESSRELFVAGCIANSVDESVARGIFDKITVFGGYGFNRCLHADTRIMDGETGERTTIGDLFRNPRNFHIHTLDKHDKVCVRPVKDVVWNGVQKTYRLKTRSGREITATGNHPFRVFSGWKNLADLAIGDRIAVSRHMASSCKKTMPEHELIAMAGLLSEGNTCHPTSLYFYNNNPDNIGDFANAATMFPLSVAKIDTRSTGRMEVCVNTGPQVLIRDTISDSEERFRKDVVNDLLSRENLRSGMFRWAEGYELTGKKATEKFVPDIIFELCDDDIALFLGRLWSGDGHFSCETSVTPYYATSSKRFAVDVSDLMLRLGIFNRVAEKRFKYRGGYKTGYTVHVTGNGSLARFVDVIETRSVGFDRDVKRLRSHLDTHGNELSSIDTIPVDVVDVIKSEIAASKMNPDEIREAAGLSLRTMSLSKSGKRGYQRAVVASIASAISSDQLDTISKSDIFWDEVVSIESSGEHDVYDLEIETDCDSERNFVANGLVVHNSHAAAYAHIAYMTAYLKSHYPVEFMAALLTSEIDASDRTKMTEHIDDCRRMGIEVVPPDVNAGTFEFGVIDTHTVRFGLGALKGVGEEVDKSIVASRAYPYRDIADLMTRVPGVTAGYAEKLVFSGAMDNFGMRRSQMLWIIPKASAEAKKAKGRTGQRKIFDEDAELDSPNIPEVPDDVRLALEKEAVGFYISGHPLMTLGSVINPLATCRISEIEHYPDRHEIMVAGIVSNLRIQTIPRSRSQHTIAAFGTIEDLTSAIKFVAWPETYYNFSRWIREDQICLIKGLIDRRKDEPQITVSEVIPIQQAGEQSRGVVVTTRDPERLYKIVSEHPGTATLYVEVILANANRCVYKSKLSVDFSWLISHVEDEIRLIGETRTVDPVAMAKRQAERMQQSEETD